MKKRQILNHLKILGSYKDPSGHIFLQEGIIYRQINYIYKDHYDHLLDSGLYSKLISLGYLLPHQEVQFKESEYSNKSVYKFIKPQKISFISYPYEWCFSQLKDAALLTLEILKISISYNMILKDASPYNVQFLDGKPVLIDTLSFEIYESGRPWVAYRQFCELFLAPLALASYRDVRLLKLLKIYLDGVPLDMARRMLPWKSWLNLGISLNIMTHSFSQKRFESDVKKALRTKVSVEGLLGIISNLENSVRLLDIKTNKSVWSDYYRTIHYTETAFRDKKALVDKFLSIAKPKTALDVGANTGVFSMLSAKRGINTVAIDNDHAVIEDVYIQIKKEGISNILPLHTDISNPSAGTGWGNKEKLSFTERAVSDVVFVLALVHHLTVSYNLTFDLIASLFHTLSKWLIIEYVPKEDSQFQRLLGIRGDIFPEYSQEKFEKVFGEFFNIINKENIGGSKRILYLMKSKKQDLRSLVSSRVPI